MMGKGQAVHRSGHLDVGKQYVDRAGVALLGDKDKRLIRHDFDTPTIRSNEKSPRKPRVGAEEVNSPIIEYHLQRNVISLPELFGDL
jgi:hypothetical protein